MTPRLPLVLLFSIAALVVAPLPAVAQDRPVVFIHGIFASDAVWQETAQRLAGELAISPHVTNQNGSDTYNTQANNLQATLGAYLTLSLRLWFVGFDQVSRLDEAIREHREMLQAIGDGDADRAAEVARAHVAGFQREIGQVISGPAVRA